MRISQKAKKAIDEKWLEGFHREYNPVTKYVYENELERKQARFFESIVADVEAKDRHEMEADYKAAENAWKRQTRQAMIDTEDRAAVTAYRDAGVEEAMWISVCDNRTCEECSALNGLIFPVDRVPDKPHYGCRCYIVPVKRLPKQPKPDIIKLSDIKVIKAVGAKSINDDVMDLITGERFYLVPGTTIKNVEVFAGKGVRKPYEKAYKYADALGGNVEDWQHVKGKGLINYYGEERLAEIHWSRCAGIGDVDRFVKRWLDED